MLTVSHVQDTEDRDLMERVRAGESDAFGRLYERHRTAATAYARRLVRQQADEQDVVADAFLRVFGILSRGLGPQDSFRPYLMRAVRNAAFDRARAEKRLELTDETAVLEGVEAFHDPVVERFDRDLVARAFRDLPDRWQTVLWLTLVEELSVEASAERLGTSRNSLTSLAYRAREGMRQAYLKQVLDGGDTTACRRAAELVVGYVRGAGPAPDRVVVQQHLDGCADCRAGLARLYEPQPAAGGTGSWAVGAQALDDARGSARASFRAVLAAGPAGAPDDFDVSA